MWDAIALTRMGSEMHMARLIAANPEHRETVVFSAGIELVIPDTEKKAETVLPPWKL
ncbi:hypothetical protein SAMN05216233_101622 [Desulfoluna spongiiphila]|uniref:P2-like prophage tail protein X n=2 Tax=Desulfoluna spongiiphila TaxID=419481 RepID=A0A1G5B4R7_9BACT|nr:hypothetical protein SAMN05216233_101622 [Desulfoluna spongiiphila]